jgi:hypothetical protein
VHRRVALLGCYPGERDFAIRAHGFPETGKMELVPLDETLALQFIDHRSEFVRASCAVGATLGDPA